MLGMIYWFTASLHNIIELAHIGLPNNDGNREGPTPRNQRVIQINVKRWWA